MKIEGAIREAVIAGESDEIRALLLNADQLELLRMVTKRGSVTASWLSDELDISIQNASAKLNRLAKARYIERSSRSAETGGIEFVYTAIRKN